MLKVTLLGTGGTQPLPDRALAAAAVTVGGRSVLLDCGEGTQVGLRRYGVSAYRLSAVLLTHYHGDHILGIPSLLKSGKVRRTYIHPDDREDLISSMQKFFGLTAEDLKLVNIVDGDTVRIGSEELEVVDVPGHTKGSVVFFYKDYIFTGDPVGSGDLFMMEATTDTYLPSLEHFMAEVLLRNEDVDYELLTGHWENLNPFSVEYLRHMLILVKGVIRGDIPIGYYTRKPGRWAGYLDANIFYPYAVLSYENEK